MPPDRTARRLPLPRPYPAPPAVIVEPAKTTPSLSQRSAGGPSFLYATETMTFHQQE
jgi:hypothetical protein